MIAELRFTNDYTLERFREFATAYKDEISVEIDDFDIVTIYTSFRLVWLRDSNLNIYCSIDFGADIQFDCQMDELSEIEF